MKEEEIRPKQIFDEYLRLAAIDTQTYFANAVRSPCLCPACNIYGEFSFEKLGFRYELCPNCETLFVSPRPVLDSFTEYYTKSPSSEYWATTFYKKTANARREQIWKPRAKDVSEIIARECIERDYSLIDIGGGYGLFAEEYRSLSGREPVVIEPGPNLAEACRSKGILVVQKFLEEVISQDLPDCRKVFTSFELFEHLHDPELFMNHLNKLMGVGDLFIFSTLSGLGLDIKVLWEASKAISPPHHLNFFNPKSIQFLLERSGFGLINVSTPGKLDLDILANNSEHISDGFWSSFISNSDDSMRKSWQNLISESGWSSHMLVVAKKI